MESVSPAGGANNFLGASLATWIKIAVTFLVPLGLYIGFTGVLDEKTVTFLVITFFAVFLLAFEFFDMGFIGVLIPICYLLFQIAPGSTVFYPWTTDLMWLILGAHILAVGLDRSGALKRLAFGCIRLCRGSFTNLMYVLLITLLIEAFLTFANAYMINVAIFWSICKAFKYFRVKQSALIMIVMEMGGGMACVITFFPLYNAMITTGFNQVFPGWNWDWIDQIVMFWPGYVFMFIFVWVLSKIYKTDKMEILSGGIEYFEEEYQKLGPISVEEKWAMFIASLILLYVGLMPLHGWNMLYAFTLIPLMFFLPGIRILGPDSFKDININMYLVIAAFAGMGAVASHIGLNKLIADHMAPLLQSQGLFMSAILITLLGVVANFILTPGGILASLSATVGAICQSIGLDPIVGAFALLYSLDLIFLPYQDMGVMVKYSAGYVNLVDYMKTCVIRFIVFFAGYVLILLPYWKLLGKF